VPEDDDALRIDALGRAQERESRRSVADEARVAQELVLSLDVEREQRAPVPLRGVLVEALARDAFRSESLGDRHQEVVDQERRLVPVAIGGPGPGEQQECRCAADGHGVGPDERAGELEPASTGKADIGFLGGPRDCRQRLRLLHAPRRSEG
jgi:hypothetical protein